MMIILTKLDRDENYESDTLMKAVTSDFSCRHVARIAHLYFARTKVLTETDLSDGIIKLFEKIFGKYDDEGKLDISSGWLNSNALYFSQKNILIQKLIQAKLEDTFSNEKWDSGKQGIFRVFQLMAANERGNLFDVVFNRSDMSYTYNMPFADLPEGLVNRAHPLLAVLKHPNQNLTATPALVVVTLKEFFIFQFLNWFVIYSASPYMVRKLDFRTCRVSNMCLGNFPLEIWKTYLEAQFKEVETDEEPFDKLFLKSVEYLWLARETMQTKQLPNEYPGTELIFAITMLLIFLQCDSMLLKQKEVKSYLGTSVYMRQLRKPLLKFIEKTSIANSGKANHLSTSFSVISMWIVLMTPWKARNRWSGVASETIKLPGSNIWKDWVWYTIQNYFGYFSILGFTLDQILQCFDDRNKQTLFYLFDAAAGPFNTSVIVTMVCCELILEDAQNEDNEHRDLVEEVHKMMPWIFSEGPVDVLKSNIKVISDNRTAVLEILQGQMKELDWNMQKRKIPTIRRYSETVRKIIRTIITADVPSSLEVLWHRISGTTKITPKPLVRLRLIFGLSEDDQIDDDGMLSSKFQKMQNPFSGPARVNVLATPSWLGSETVCYFKKLSVQGHLQMQDGSRSCVNDSVTYIGDPLMNPPPVRSYESEFLVWLAILISCRLNAYFFTEQQEFDEIDGNVVPKFRVNLRFLASWRNLFVGSVVALLLNLVMFRFSINVLLLTICILLIGRLSFEDNLYFIIFAVTVSLPALTLILI